MRFMMIVKPPAYTGLPDPAQFEAMGRYNDELQRALAGVGKQIQGTVSFATRSELQALAGKLEELAEKVGAPLTLAAAASLQGLPRGGPDVLFYYTPAMDETMHTHGVHAPEAYTLPSAVALALARRGGRAPGPSSRAPRRLQP